MEPIQRAIKALQTQQKLADALGLKSQGQVSQWVVGRRPVPPKRCVQIELATGGAVTRYELRPDVFGPAPGSVAEEQRQASELARSVVSAHVA